MKTRTAFSLPLFIALSISACGSLMHPDIQQNPHPKMRYDVTMTIDNVPGPFDSVTGFVQYEITNKDCIPEDPLAGVRAAPTAHPRITFRRVGDNVYTATVYADLMKDEDYYGKGVCRWSLISVVGELKAHGTTFEPYILLEELAASKSNTGYFWKPYYQKAPLADYNDMGVPFSVYNTAPDRSQYFSITIAAMEHFE